jgi:hypothetical protein
MGERYAVILVDRDNGTPSVYAEYTGPDARRRAQERAEIETDDSQQAVAVRLR